MSTLVRTHHPKYEGLIICMDHLAQITSDGDLMFTFDELAVSQAAYWGHRCLMCGVLPAPNRLCESAGCRQPLHPQWPAVYCCNNCALDDV